MNSPQVPRSQRGFIQYIVLGVLLILAAGVIAFLQHRHAAPNDLTASLTGTGGVTITTPDNNSTVTSPVQVTANVASGFTGPVKTMEVFRDNTLVYQGPGTTVNTRVKRHLVCKRWTIEKADENSNGTPWFVLHRPNSDKLRFHLPSLPWHWFDA